MVRKDKVLFPGDAITTEEEFGAGKNTFEEGGLIKASAVGEADFDNSSKEVSVKGSNIEQLKPRDIVIGMVTSTKDSSANVEIIKTEKGKVFSTKMGQLPVRNVSNSYVKSVKKLFKIGDLVKAKVAVSNPLGIDLKTNEEGLGVINAYCSNCRKELSYNNGKLKCLSCGNIEERKWFEDKDDYSDRGPPRDRGFKRRFDSNKRFGGNRRFNGNKRFSNKRESFSNRRRFSNENRGYKSRKRYS